MGLWIGSLLLFCPILFSAETGDTLLRIKLSESIFAEKFTAERVERILEKATVPQLAKLERENGAKESVVRVRNLLHAIATDTANSKSFKEQYATWLAEQLDVDELRRYYDFVRSDFGKKITDLEGRAQPLFLEAVGRISRGRFESIMVLLGEAQNE